MWDRFVICRVWAKLAHDFGLYGIQARLDDMGFRPGYTLNLDEDERDHYNNSVALAEATGPWSRKIGEL